MDPITPNVTPDGFSLKAYARPEHGDFAIWYFRRFPNGDVARGETKLVPLERPHDSPVPPAMTMDPLMAQMLANSLWDAGVRPVQSSGSVGQVQAMQAHIDGLNEHLRRMGASYDREADKIPARVQAMADHIKDLREQNAHLRSLLDQRAGTPSLDPAVAARAGKAQVAAGVAPPVRPPLEDV